MKREMPRLSHVILDMLRIKSRPSTLSAHPGICPVAMAEVLAGDSKRRSESIRLFPDGPKWSELVKISGAQVQ